MFLRAVSAASVLGYGTGFGPMAFAADAELDDIRNNWKALLAPNPLITLSTEPIKKSKAEWQQGLNRLQFDVLRQEATEAPGSSPLNREKRPGTYVCAGCLLPLFTSRMKYESGTGWPSFFTSIPKHLATKADFRLAGEIRTEYHCVRCGGHQGHLFPDGPPPTRERWCNNGAALLFLPV
jgi:peptide-methionine (R)-S-oxide reductase